MAWLVSKRMPLKMDVTTSKASALIASLVIRIRSRYIMGRSTSLQLPLDGATDRVGDGIGGLLVGERGVDGRAQIVGADLVGMLPVVVHAADVADLLFGVEHEGLRRVLGAVGARHALRFVAGVGEVELFLIRALGR